MLDMRFVGMAYGSLLINRDLHQLHAALNFDVQFCAGTSETNPMFDDITDRTDFVLVSRKQW